MSDQVPPDSEVRVVLTTIPLRLALRLQGLHPGKSLEQLAREALLELAQERREPWVESFRKRRTGPRGYSDPFRKQKDRT